MVKNTNLENLSYQGGYNLETIRCPLCGQNRFKRIVIEQRIPIVRCLQCGLVFANPRPDKEGLQKFYAHYFPPESASLWQKQMSEIFMLEGLRRIREFAATGKRVLAERPRILDIGCGMGFFLDLMKKESWDARGIEPAPEAARHAQNVLKLDVFEGTLEDFDAQGIVYDAVTLWYVLEHVPNPGEILERSFRLLKPGGLLIIRVPNQNAPIDQWLGRLGLGRYFLMNPPRHLFDYSPKTISGLLAKAGYQVLDIRNGIPRKTGTFLELVRRHLWYSFFEALFRLSGGKIIRGSSITVYAKKPES